MGKRSGRGTPTLNPMHADSVVAQSESDADDQEEVDLADEWTAGTSPRSGGNSTAPVHRPTMGKRSARGTPTLNPMHADSVVAESESDAEDQEEVDLADEWTAGTSPRSGGNSTSSYGRCGRCGLGGGLSRQEVAQLYSVTFLSQFEIKNCWTLFNHITERLEGLGDEVGKVTKTVVGKDGQPQSREFPALTTQQLRDNLPEFKCNVFLERLVRVFSETGDPQLTFLELLDMYSTLSPDAPVKWKARTCFCVFDFDEDNKLGELDLVKTLALMTKGTHTTTTQGMWHGDVAAINIQRMYRGFAARKQAREAKQGSTTTATEERQQQQQQQQQQQRKTATNDVHNVVYGSKKNGEEHKWLLSDFISKMTEECTTLEDNVMSYSYFESTVCGFEYFVDNFTVRMTDPREWFSKGHSSTTKISEHVQSETRSESMQTGHNHEDPNASPRFTAADPNARRVAENVWEQHMTRYGRRSKLTRKQVNIMLKETVPLTTGKLRGDNECDSWTEREHVEYDDFLEWFTCEANSDSGEILRYTNRMLKLNSMWPSWTETEPGATLEEEKERGRMPQDVARTLFHHTHLCQWRVRRAKLFQDFVETVQAAIEKDTKNAEEIFHNWDKENNLGLARQELADGLRTLLKEEQGALRHKADLLMYILVDLDPHGPGFIYKKDWLRFFEEAKKAGDDFAYKLAMAVGKVDLTCEWTWDGKQVETKLPEAKIRHKTEEQREFVWSWQDTEEKFLSWWNDTVHHVTVARTEANLSESGDPTDTDIESRDSEQVSLKKKDFAETFWLAEEETLIDAALEINWSESIEWCEQLWTTADLSGSGWVMESDARKLLSHIVCEDGTRLDDASKGNRRFDFHVHRLHLINLDIRLDEQLSDLEYQLRECEGEPEEVVQHLKDRRKTHLGEKKEIDKWLALHQDDLEGLHNLRRESHALEMIKKKLEQDRRKSILGNSLTPEVIKELELGKTKLNESDREALGIAPNQAIIAGIFELRDVIVRRESFTEWWRQLHWLAKHYTQQNMQLVSLWDKIVGQTGSDNLPVWRARAVMVVLWNVSEYELATRDGLRAFHRRLLSWFHEYDRDESGFVSCSQFSEWWVLQPQKMIDTAKTYNWENVELELDKTDIVEDVNSMLEEIEEDMNAQSDENAPGQNIRDQQIGALLKQLDHEIHQLDSVQADGGNLVLIETVKAMDSTTTPYGVLTGGTRLPLLRSRLRVLRFAKDKRNRKYLAALHADATVGCASSLRKWMRSIRAEERDGVHYAHDELEKEGVKFTVADALGDFVRQGRFRCCRYVDMHTITATRQSLAHLLRRAKRRLLGNHSSSVQRQYSRGVAEIFHRMEFMLHVNAGHSLVWLCLVIVPRDAVLSRDGLVATLRAVFEGLIFTPEEGKRSLFYDGYVKQPVMWPTEQFGVLLRLDLLYFVAIIVSVALGLFALMETMEMQVGQIAQGVSMQNLGVKRTDARKCAEVLGSYSFGSSDEVSATHMRQRIRRRIDEWAKPYREEKELEKMAWRKENGADCTTRCNWLLYEFRLLIGATATVVLLCGHILALVMVLLYRKSLTVFGVEVNTMLISILDKVVPALIHYIVIKENHVKHGDELKQIMYRMYFVKIIQLTVILYSLAKISSCQGDGTDAISIGGMDVCQGVERPECVEALFGQTFFRLAFTDATVFVVQHYVKLYLVNHGLPKSFQCGKCSKTFRHTRDLARERRLNPSSFQRRCGPCLRALRKLTYHDDDSDLIPGVVAGTTWKIVAREDGFIYRHIYGGQDRTEMPDAVKAALRRSFVLQKRTHHFKHQWWKRGSQTTYDTMNAEIQASFEPPEGSNNLEQFLKFDWDSQFRNRRCKILRRCCRRDTYGELGPTVSFAMRLAGEYGLGDVQKGMALTSITLGGNEHQDTHALQIQGKTISDVAKYLEVHKGKKLRLTFKHSAERSVLSWATGKRMQHLTTGNTTYSDLTVMAMLLIDAGISTNKELEANNWNPDELASVISKQRGNHRYKYLSRAAARSHEDSVALTKADKFHPSQADKPDPKTTLMTLISDLDTLENAACDATPPRHCIAWFESGVLSLYATTAPDDALRAVGLANREDGGTEEILMDRKQVNDLFTEILCGDIRHSPRPNLKLEKELKIAMETMSSYTHEKVQRQESKDKVSFAAFNQWWNEILNSWPSRNYWESCATKGTTVLGKAILQLNTAVGPRAATMRIKMQDCISVNSTRISAKERHIFLDTPSRRVTLSWSPNECELLRIESGEASWDLMLRAAVPTPSSNWGIDLQQYTDCEWARFIKPRLIKSYRLSELKQTQTRKVTNTYRASTLSHKAEQHVANGHRYAAGDSMGTEVVLREIFDEYDLNQDGQLDSDEVGKVLKLLRSWGSPEAVAHDKTAKLHKHRKITRKEREACIKEIEKDSQRKNGLVDFDEFAAWWEARRKKRQHKGLAAEYWTSLRHHAAEEFEKASTLYRQLELVLKERLVDQIEDKSRENQLVLPEQHRRTLPRIAMAELAQVAKEYGVDAATVRDYQRAIQVVTTKRQLVEHCAHGEESLSKRKLVRRAGNRITHTRKPSSKAIALHHYEKALRTDETNAHLRHKVHQLTQQFNRAAHRIKYNEIHDFAMHLVNCQCDWEEVTEEFNKQRHVYIHQTQMNSKQSAGLLMSSIYRQAFIWVGTTWCPWLPIIGVISQVFMIWSLSHAMLGTWWAKKPAYIAEGSAWPAAETYSSFMKLSLLTNLIAVVPLLIWFNEKPTCGPHSVNDQVDIDTDEVVDCDAVLLVAEECGHGAKVYETIFVFFQWLEESSRDETHFLTGEIRVISNFFFTPPVLLVMLFGVWARYRYYKAKYIAASAELKDLREDTEEERREAQDRERDILKQRQDDTGKYASVALTVVDAIRHKMNSKDAQAARRRDDKMQAKRKAEIRDASTRAILHNQQLSLDARMLKRVNKYTDRWVQKMDKTGLVAGNLADGSIAETQSILELASCAVHAPTDLWKIIGLSTVWIGNIDLHAATEENVCKQLCDATHSNAILHCSVRKVSDQASRSEGSNQTQSGCSENKGKREYPHASWAICTFVKKPDADKVLGENGVQPRLDRWAEQPANGRSTWHAVAWMRAVEEFGGETMFVDLPAAANDDTDKGFVANHLRKLTAKLQWAMLGSVALDPLLNESDGQTGKGTPANNVKAKLNIHAASKNVSIRGQTHHNPIHEHTESDDDADD